MRQYRKKLVEAGQASPLYLSILVIRLIRKEFRPGIKILDVGCGLGHRMGNIKSNLPNYFTQIEGIDWSPASIEYHKENNYQPYNHVLLCKSDGLPYRDQEFDICLSMENLEHLYAEASINALKEMQRVAQYIMLTTPSPEQVINFNFLHQEIKEAVDDPDLLTQKDFVCLESAVYKSVLLPKSLIKAGFRQFCNLSHSFFWAKSDDIFLDQVQCVAITERNEMQRCLKANGETDYRYKYVVLLIDYVALDANIEPHKTYRLRHALSAAYLLIVRALKSSVVRQSPSLANCLKNLRAVIVAYGLSELLCNPGRSFIFGHVSGGIDGKRNPWPLSELLEMCCYAWSIAVIAHKRQAGKFAGQRRKWEMLTPSQV
jgi:SAM-dependent methyltransferase